MKTIKLLYVAFLPILLLFFWRNAIKWFNDRVNNTEEGDLFLNIGLCTIEFIALFLILHKRNFIKRSCIHLICIGWEIIMMSVLMYNGEPISVFVKCLLWPLLFEATFLFVSDDKRRVDSFRKFYYWVAVLGFFVFIVAMQMKAFESQSNMIYFLALAMPMLLTTRNTRLRNLLLIIISFVCVMSMKRSMILSIVLFWGVVCMRNMFKSGKKITAIFLSVLIIGIGYVSFTMVENLSGGNLSSRLDSDQKDVTNGREEIYLITIDMIVNSSPVEFIMGHGHMAVKRDSILDISAHNEWLEILYDYGLIILFLYICLWLHLIKQWLFHYRENTRFFLPFTLSLCIFVVMSMVSQLVVYISYFLYLVMLWATAEAATEDEYAMYINNMRTFAKHNRK
jgi:O-Antigen ligase.